MITAFRGATWGHCAGTKISFHAICDIIVLSSRQLTLHGVTHAIYCLGASSLFSALFQVPLVLCTQCCFVSATISEPQLGRVGVIQRILLVNSA